MALVTNDDPGNKVRKQVKRGARFVIFIAPT